MESFKIPWQIKIQKSSDFLPVLWRFGQCLADVEIRFRGGARKRRASGQPPDPLMAHSLALMGLNKRFFDQITESLNSNTHGGVTSSRRIPSSSHPTASVVIHAQEGISREAFEFFLEYIYFVKGGEDITEAVAPDLLTLAKDYDCRRLSLDLETFLIRTLNQRNLPERFELGRRFDFHQLVLKCLNMAAYTKPLFEEEGLWRRISKEFMKDLLSMDQLPLDEEQLFNFFLQWVSEVIPTDCLTQVRSSLKHHIRFPSMSVDYLATKVDTSSVLTKEELLNVAFDAACSPSVPRRSGFPSKQRRLVPVIQATCISKDGQFSVERDEGSMNLKRLKDKFAIAMAVSPETILLEFDMKDGAFRRFWNTPGFSQSQINVDEIDCDMIETSSLKIVTLRTLMAERQEADQPRLILRLHPDSTIGVLQAQIAQELTRGGLEVLTASVAIISPAGNDVLNDKATLTESRIKDNDVVKFKILKIKTEMIGLNVTDMAGDTVTFKMKRSTPLKKMKSAYTEKFHIREEEKPYCRFLYDGNRINDDDTPNSLGLDDGDTIEFFWAHDFDLASRKKSLPPSPRELELDP